MKNLKRAACIAGAVILAGIYILTLIFSLTDSSQARSWLTASLYCTVAVPVVLYAFLLITRQLRDREKDAIRDPFLKVMYDKYVCVVG